MTRNALIFEDKDMTSREAIDLATRNFNYQQIYGNKGNDTYKVKNPKAIHSKT